MTDGTRILRTVAVPVVVAVVFLLLVPKTCQKALNSKKLRPNTVAAPTDTSLHISSDNPAPASKPIAWPAGVDEQRVQYLVEINQRFAEPYLYRLPKPGATLIGFDPASAEPLVKAGWFEGSAENGFTPTHDASLHLPGLMEDPQAWRVPLAARKFVHVISFDDLGGNKGRAGFTWQWEPNEAGRAVKSSFGLHQGTADLAGGGEHPWDLNGVTVDNEWR